MAQSTATIRKLTRQFSQKHYDRYITQNIRTMAKARSKGHKDFQWTDEDIAKAAHDLARINEVGYIYT